MIALSSIPSRPRLGHFLRLVWGLVMGLSVSFAAGTTLPPSLLAALERAKIPASAVAVLVASAEGNSQPPRLVWRTQEAMNPASLMKLLTTPRHE